MQLRLCALLFAGAAAARIHMHDASEDEVEEFISDDMHDVSMDEIEEFASEDLDMDLFSSAELSADEALLSLDLDGDGGISKAEFQSYVDVKETAEYLAWLREHAGEEWPTEPEAQFQFLDEDASGHLDPHEIERATSMAEVAVLLSRQEAQSNGSSLEGTMGKKVKDPRCETAGEGFKCLTDTTMIYCTVKKRMGDEETCGWGGQCKRGILGSGGCDYPMCKSKINGLYCGSHGGSTHVVKCDLRGAHGRFERESSKMETCSGGCEAFADGKPPSRRRRTCNGGHVCTLGACATTTTTTTLAYLQWAVDGCAKVKPESRNMDKQLARSETAAVRCCSYTHTKCESKLVGCKRLSYEAAEETCAAEGMRLCSWHEMKSNTCCGTGCNMDVELAWVLRDSYAKTPADFNPNTYAPLLTTTTTTIARLQWTVDGCPKVHPESRNKDKQLASSATAAVRCCSYTETKCESKLVGCKRQSYEAAEETCAAQGMRLCSWHELKTNVCCGSGCNMDLEPAWVLRDSYAKTPADFNPNTYHKDSHAPTPAAPCYKRPDPQDPPFARCR
jgi:Ca2+-binding EF-hand superfamily protein